MTLQRRDLLTYLDHKYALDCDIFKEYFQENPDRKPEKIGFDSSLHRGYYAEFEIIDNQLFAIDIRVNIDFDRDSGEDISKSVIDKALPKLKICDWYSGFLVLFSLTQTTCTHAQYLRITLNKGIIEKYEALSEQEYHDLGNHAYDYF